MIYLYKCTFHGINGNAPFRSDGIHSFAGCKNKGKVFFNIRKTRMGMTGEWFRKMTGTDDIWEFRTLYNNQYIRLFAFWDKKDQP